ncbi:MAG: ABC transporter substrate-binding protein [Pseudomonadota bacterium]
MGGWGCRLLVGAAFLGLGSAAAVGQTNIDVGYLHPQERELTLSLIDRPADDLGMSGADLAITDNNTTGQFTGQKYTLHTEALGDDGDPAAAVDTLADAGARWIVADLPADQLLAVADAAADKNILVFNVGAQDDGLRTENCHANIVHIAPSNAMLADALAQFLVWKKWPRWFLVEGSHAKDKAFADAIRRAATRFGGRIVEERVFEDTGGARTTDSGHVQVQKQLPVFMQSASEHDVVIVADESEVFGAYLPYHIWDPRPVAGSAGLQPKAWSPAHEQWGAIQVQNRFMDAYNRRMQPEDMLAWMAVRAVGEAATRTNGGDPDAIREYILGPDFQLAAFKGEALSLRDWNQQLRQPILLADQKTVVSASPQEGFLHPSSFLDTLGYDRPESACSLGSQ